VGPERLRDADRHAGVSFRGRSGEDRDVARTVATGRQEERLDHDLSRAGGDAASDRLAEVGRRELEMGHLDGAAREALAQRRGERLDHGVRGRLAAPVVDQDDGRASHQ
jgi:hypothetical protein